MRGPTLRTVKSKASRGHEGPGLGRAKDRLEPGELAHVRTAVEDSARSSFTPGQSLKAFPAPATQAGTGPRDSAGDQLSSITYIVEHYKIPVWVLYQIDFLQHLAYFCHFLRITMTCSQHGTDKVKTAFNYSSSQQCIRKKFGHLDPLGSTVRPPHPPPYS